MVPAITFPDYLVLVSVLYNYIKSRFFSTFGKHYLPLLSHFGNERVTIFRYVMFFHTYAILIYYSFTPKRKIAPYHSSLQASTLSSCTLTGCCTGTTNQVWCQIKSRKLQTKSSLSACLNKYR